MFSCNDIFHGPATHHRLPYNIWQLLRIILVKVKHSNLNTKNKIMCRIYLTTIRIISKSKIVPVFSFAWRTYVSCEATSWRKYAPGIKKKTLLTRSLCWTICPRYFVSISYLAWSNWIPNEILAFLRNSPSLPINKRIINDKYCQNNVIFVER